MSGGDVEVYLSQVHDGSVSSGFRALYEERLLLDVTLLIEEHHFQVQQQTSDRSHTNPHARTLTSACGNTLESSMWYNMYLNDAQLTLDPLHSKAHKALLATQSDYFRVMFTADMRERDQDKIHMKGLTAAGFGHVLRFMYYGSLELSMPTVQEILQVKRTHTHTHQTFHLVDGTVRL